MHPPTRPGFLAFLVAALGCAPAVSPPQLPARPSPVRPGLVFAAETWTGDAAAPRARVVVVSEDRIARVLGEAGMDAALFDESPEPLPPGAFIVPGLVDAHAHLAGLGFSLTQLQLRGQALAAIATMVKRAHGERPAGAWIAGRGWDQNLWSPPEFPLARTLDEAAPGRPVWLRRVDGHAGWASSEALRRAGITRDTKDPPGGRIVRDAQGNPTGVLVDNAMDLMGHALPDSDAGEIERAILLAQDHVLARGLTTVHEMGIGPVTEAVYRKLDADGRLRVRVYALLADEPGVMKRLAVPPEADDPSRRFHVAGVKLYADGALGSRGAALLAPYADEPAQSGLLVTSREHIVEVTKAALRTGWQVAVHAIGDRGNRIVLDAFEEALRAVPDARDPRLRVEHAQILAPTDIPRFAKLGVIASMQPTHATSDMPWAGARLGRERLAGAYAWQSLLQSGAHLCAGSDFPVEEADPLLGLYAAMTRKDTHGQPPSGWLARERLSPDQALGAFTGGAAYCAHREASSGVLRQGAVADLTVLDRDITKVPPAEALQAKVLMTVVGGRVEWRAP